MKLLYANASPKPRRVRVLIAEKALQGISEIAVSPFEHPPEVVAASLLSRVPALILPDDSAPYDSPVICEYLDTLSPAHPIVPDPGPARWLVRRRHALTDGIIDASYAIACEVGPPVSTSSRAPRATCCSSAT